MPRTILWAFFITLLRVFRKQTAFSEQLLEKNVEFVGIRLSERIDKSF